MRKKIRQTIQNLKLACWFLGCLSVVLLSFLGQTNRDKRLVVLDTIELNDKLSILEKEINALKTSQGLPLPASQLPPGTYTTRYFGGTVLAESTINHYTAIREYFVPESDNYWVFGQKVPMDKRGKKWPRKQPAKWIWEFEIKKRIEDKKTGKIQLEAKTLDKLDEIVMAHIRKSDYGTTERIVIKTKNSKVRTYDIDTLAG